MHISIQVPLENVLEDCDRAKLHAPFTVEEVNNATFQMKRNKTPGLDGFTIEFYQHYWPLISKGIMSLFDGFYLGKLGLACLN